LKQLLVIADVAGVFSGVVGIGKQDVGAGEAVLDGVEARLGFALGGDGAGGFLSVLAVAARRASEMVIDMKI